ncbi:MAG: hypothetical protein QOG42_624, partial [Solirubrobacteraceae bacterium]|nr:hypothetical protein [Solirubrobacteraceae bacterium]
FAPGEQGAPDLAPPAQDGVIN